MARYELELRNLPREYILNYLREAGGVEDGALAVKGEGWRAWLEAMEPARITVMVIPRDLLVIEGEDEAVVEPVYRHMRQKTMRGGG